MLPAFKSCFLLFTDQCFCKTNQAQACHDEEAPKEAVILITSQRKRDDVEMPGSTSGYRWFLHGHRMLEAAKQTAVRGVRQHFHLSLSDREQTSRCTAVRELKLS